MTIEASQGQGPLEEDEQYILLEHLPHELNMLAAALKTWNDCIGGDGLEYLRILAFENFWLHARNLIEFFYRSGEGVQAGALRFVNSTEVDFELSGKAIGELMDRINQQISHLQRKRGLYAGSAESPEGGGGELNGTDAEHVFKRITRAVNIFEENLTPAASEYWKPRQPLILTLKSALYSSACNYFEATSLTIDPKDYKFIQSIIIPSSG